MIDRKPTSDLRHMVNMDELDPAVDRLCFWKEIMDSKCCRFLKVHRKGARSDARSTAGSRMIGATLPLDCWL